ncbi:hypothetical protein JTB14_036308 [Gonioctena quinquepunctata]|nr:hypothetical protein JTB14_036308 [Gonioctena quinquepunctata]
MTLTAATRKAMVAKYHRRYEFFRSVTNSHSQGAIPITKNPEHHKRTEHIDIKYHFIRYDIRQEMIEVEYISISDQQAGISTKGLPSPAFQKQRQRLDI